MLGPNPSKIQQVSAFTSSGELPLVLIHDGGGTCFSYRLLGHLGRPVYAIHNPRFQSGRPWKGGIDEMAGVYIELVRSLLSSGTFILGGWSLGGLISLQMAKLLEGDDELCVAGIVMIDSIFPAKADLMEGGQMPISSHVPDFSASCPPETRVAVRRSLAQSVSMLQSWTPPVWDDNSSTSSISGDTTPSELASLPSSWISSEQSPTASSSTIASNANLSEISEGSSSPAWDDQGRRHFAAKLDARLRSYLARSDSATNVSRLSSTSMAASLSGTRNARPTAVLLRASEYVPSPPGTLCRVDLRRKDRELGWQHYDHSLFSCVVDIPGHHFDLFAPQHVGHLTDELKGACRLITRQWADGRGKEDR